MNRKSDDEVKKKKAGNATRKGNWIFRGSWSGFQKHCKHVKATDLKIKVILKLMYSAWKLMN